jgi:Zn-dependent M28 family amino/carboxypeptidase
VAGVEERPVSAAISEERMRESVDVLCNRFFPRNYRNPGKLDLAAEWIARRFREADLEVTFQEYTLAEGTYRNVVARVEGNDPSLGATVLGAHYDAYGDLPGADDNASAVAALLELALTLPAARPERTVYLVAFCTEEPPFFGSEDMGSFRFARELKERGVEVGLMVSIEMVGYFSDEPGSQKFPVPGLGLFYPNRGDFLAVVGDLGSGRTIRTVKRRMRETGAIPVYSFRGPATIPGIDWSDHWGFRRLGMPAVMITDTAFMRNPNYHTDADTPETLDYPRMVNVVRSLHGILREP